MFVQKNGDSLSLDAEQRRTRARLAAHAMHAKHDARVTTAPGRAAFLARFEREVDPDGILSPDERARRAGHARRAYMARLAYKKLKSDKEAKAKSEAAEKEAAEIENLLS